MSFEVSCSFCKPNRQPVINNNKSDQHFKPQQRETVKLETRTKWTEIFSWCLSVSFPDFAPKTTWECRGSTGEWDRIDGGGHRRVGRGEERCEGKERTQHFLRLIRNEVKIGYCDSMFILVYSGSKWHFVTVNFRILWLMIGYGDYFDLILRCSQYILRYSQYAIFNLECQGQPHFLTQISLREYSVEETLFRLGRNWASEIEGREREGGGRGEVSSSVSDRR